MDTCRKLLASLVVVFALSACGWTGTGYVVHKQYDPSTVIPSGKTTTSITECYRLIVKDVDGKNHSGCVKSEVWEMAEVGEKITLTKETRP